MNVRVSKHAYDRFKERFRLMFHRDMMEPSRRNYLIKKLYGESTPCDFALKQKIGFYNSICVRYNAKVNYSMYKDKIIFAWAVDEGDVIILTALNRDMKVCGYSF